MVLLGSVAARVDVSSGDARDQGTIPIGVWTGTFAVGGEHGFVRVDFEASLAGRAASYPDVARLVRADLVDIDVNGSEIRFRLPDSANVLHFDGVREGDIINGAVTGPDGRGSFVLHRELTLPLSDYAPFIGSYQLAGPPLDGTDAARVGAERIILVMNGASGQTRPGYFEDDRFVTMYPVAEATFMSVLGEVLEFDLAPADTRLRLQMPAGGTYVGAANDAYREEPVSFVNGDVQLAGSLLIPEGNGPFPVVIFIHGSQGSDRHMYRHYADCFARHGIGALIYDKRGTGTSTGNWRQAGLDTLADDALAAAKSLKGHPRIDGQAIGVWGISQGGWIVALAAQRDPDIAFVIGVSAAGTTPGKQEAFRIRNVLVDAGLRGFRLEASHLWHKMLYPIGHAATKPYVPLPKAIKHMVGGLAVSPFFDPEPVWRQVRQPVLLIYGEADYLVDPVASPKLITAALERGGNSAPTVLTFETGDHNIRVTETGKPSEVLRESRFAPGYFEAKLDWIRSVAVPAKERADRHLSTPNLLEPS